MSTRTIMNLVLAAVVIALAWLALDDEDALTPGDAVPVTSLNPADIDHIRIEARGRRPVELRRDGETWQITEPYRTPADPFRINALLGLVSATSEKGFRAAGNDLSQYGLEPPAASVWLGDQELRFGATDPVEHLRYVQSADQVHLLPDHWFSQVFGEAAAWVDPRPLGGATDLVAIIVPQAHWTLTERGWQRSPVDPDLGADAGPQLADAWRHARALSVRTLDPAEPWSDEVRISLRATPDPVVFAVAEVQDAVLLGNATLGVQYRFLPRQGDALLDRRIAVAN